jgi:hypothetical protein
MASKVSKQLGRPLWKIVRLLGWLGLVASLTAAILATLRYLEFRRLDEPLVLLGGGAVAGLFLSAILIKGARQSDVAWICSKCGARLGKETKLCPGCLTVLE